MVGVARPASVTLRYSPTQRPNARNARISRPSAFRCRPGGCKRRQRRPSRAEQVDCRLPSDTRQPMKARLRLGRRPARWSADDVTAWHGGAATARSAPTRPYRRCFGEMASRYLILTDDPRGRGLRIVCSQFLAKTPSATRLLSALGYFQHGNPCDGPTPGRPATAALRALTGVLPGGGPGRGSPPRLWITDGATVRAGGPRRGLPGPFRAAGGCAVRRWLRGRDGFVRRDSFRGLR